MLKNIIKYISKNSVPISVSIICIYALYLRIMVLYGRELWIDERYSLSLMQGNFLDLLKELKNIGVCGYMLGDLYLYFPFFKIFSYNKWALAIPCIISTILGFWLLYLICKRYFKSIWAYFVTFILVCFNGTLTWHATEIRAYAILPTLALATFYLLQRIADLDFNLSVRKKIFNVIFFVLVIWFHVYGIFMFISSFLFVLLSKYKEKNFNIYFKHSISFAAIILCFAMPFWLYCVFGSHQSIAAFSYNIFEYIPNPFSNIIGFLKGIFCNLVGFKKLYFLFLGVFIPLFFSYRDRNKQLLFLFLNVIIPINFILLSDIVIKYWFLQRQFIWVMPFFAFYLGWVWDSLFQQLRGHISKKDISAVVPINKT